MKHFNNIKIIFKFTYTLQKYYFNLDFYIILKFNYARIIDMRYTTKVEMEIEIDFFETDKTDDETKEEINDIIIDTFSVVFNNLCQHQVIPKIVS